MAPTGADHALVRIVAHGQYEELVVETLYKNMMIRYDQIHTSNINFTNQNNILTTTKFTLYKNTGTY